MVPVLLLRLFDLDLVFQLVDLLGHPFELHLELSDFFLGF